MSLDLPKIILLFFGGTIIGSFLNVLIYRLPRKTSIIWPPSTCPLCKHRLRWTDLIPIISYLLLRGRCRYCQRPINRLYPIIELLAGFSTLIWAFRFGLFPSEVWKLVLIYGLIVISCIDLQAKIIPNKLTYPLMVGGLIYSWAQGGFLSALIGGLTGGGILLLIHLLYPKGMGMGDIKLLTMLGIYLGWQGVIHTLFFGSLAGVLILFPLLLSGKIHQQDPIPFGPFLAVGTLTFIFFF